MAKPKPTYGELLKNPRWQRRRLEIMRRDNFICLNCESRNNTLNVHHCYYERGLKPWEYPDNALKTLCEDCHRLRQEVELALQRNLADLTIQQLDMLRCDVLYYAYQNSFDKLIKLVNPGFLK